MYAWLGRHVVDASCAAYKHLVPWLQSIIMTVLCSSCFGGLALGIAMICDVWLLLSLPVLISFSGTMYLDTFHVARANFMRYS